MSGEGHVVVKRDEIYWFDTVVRSESSLEYSNCGSEFSGEWPRCAQVLESFSDVIDNCPRQLALATGTAVRLDLCPTRGERDRAVYDTPSCIL